MALFDVHKQTAGYDLYIIDKKTRKIGAGINYKKKIVFKLIGEKRLGEEADARLERQIRNLE